MALKLALEILSPLPLTSREDGRMMFDLWQQYLPGLLPDRFGNWEPIDRPFDSKNIESALDSWRWPFLALKRKPVVYSSIWMRKGVEQRLHATWKFELNATAVTQDDLVAFLKAASVALKADFSCLQLLTPSELERGRASEVVTALNKQATKFTFSIPSKKLQERIPDLFWATVFGAPYLTMFGRDRLLTAPSYRAESLSNEAVYLQMTQSLFGHEFDSLVLDAARSRVKAHLGADAFFQSERDRSIGYRAPQFSFL